VKPISCGISAQIYEIFGLDRMNAFAFPLVLLLVTGLPLLPAMGLMSGPFRRGAILLAPWAAQG
jgi:hypothetical protein